MFRSPFDVFREFFGDPFADPFHSPLFGFGRESSGGGGMRSEEEGLKMGSLKKCISGQPKKTSI